MKVLFVSDTHGDQLKFRRAVVKTEPDMVVHLGDIVRCEDEIKDIAQCPVEMVAGNCDGYFSGLPMEKTVEIEGKKFFLLHGHTYEANSRSDLAYMIKHAHDENVDYVCFGHIHMPLFLTDGELGIINPGSISRPRQKDGVPTCVLLETGTEFKFSLVCVNGFEVSITPATWKKWSKWD